MTQGADKDYVEQRVDDSQWEVRCLGVVLEQQILLGKEEAKAEEDPHNVKDWTQTSKHEDTQDLGDDLSVNIVSF